ncbi:MAG: sulfurase, partial [Cyanobacteria bacterium RYN_339]|nr:sulfurase [Cyanobacteria bacterium RYN_339]
DRHHFGDVVLEVTCPRSPCMKIEQNNGLPGLLLRVRETGRIGWLYRVIQQGQVSAPCEIGVEPGPYPQWSAARVMDVFTRAKVGQAAAEGRELLACEALVGTWRDVLRETLS